jgi:tryptophanyl-tRNA synthetase
MGILTDSTPLEEPKNPDTCAVFALYQHIADQDQVAEMRAQYLAGGYGFGHAKKALLDAVLERFAAPRARFAHYMEHPNEIDEALSVGAAKARLVAQGVLDRVREKLGY